MSSQDPTHDPRCLPGAELLRLVPPRCPRVFPLSLEDAAVRRAEIAEIERLCFGWEPRHRSRLEDELQARGSTALILEDTATLDLIGFTVARRTTILREAYVALSAVRPEYQGQKFIGVLRSRLEDELHLRGYEYLASESRSDNGYAAKLLRHYGDRVVERREIPVRSPGEYPREFIKIRIASE